MDERIETFAGVCGCAASGEGIGCEPCPPKMLLTPEEEEILARMRQLKEQVRPIAAKLHEIRREFGTEADGGWTELSGRLDSLRNEWKQWEEKLDDAIEQKLIALGHREPRR